MEAIEVSGEKHQYVWIWVAALAGLAVAFALRELLGEGFSYGVAWIGYGAGILSLGTSNVFQPDQGKHYQQPTQRWIAYMSLFALGAGCATLLPAIS